VSETVALAVGGVSLAIWLYLLIGHGRFWQADQKLEIAGQPDKWPAVVAVIPARDEAETIGRTVTSLLGQNYQGDLKIVVVDDNSADGTREAAGNSSRLLVVSGKPLISGWTGKLWAVSQGVEAAQAFSPDAEYILFTDADIEHHAENIAELIWKAEDEKIDLVSLMVKLRCESFWERLLIPAFVFFFQKLYPFPKVNNPENKMAAAAGGCMLVRLSALLAVGGIDPIKDRLIDDCAMGQLIKSKGPIWLGLAEKTKSLRAYDQLSEIWHMVARTAFVQLDHSILKLIGTVIAMAVIYLAGPVLVFVGGMSGNPIITFMGTGIWGVMCIAYGPTLKLYQRNAVTGLMLPMAGLFYTLMTISSAIRHWRGVGGAWKGRSYPKTTAG